MDLKFTMPSFVTGFAAGFGTGFFAREVTDAGAFGLRPLAKAVIKGGLSAYDRSVEMFAHAGESIEDLIAEARADLATQGAAETVEPAVAEPVAEAAEARPAKHAKRAKSTRHAATRHSESRHGEST